MPASANLCYDFVQDMKGVEHHIHQRKREGSLEPYPSGRAGVRWLDRAAIAAGILGPIMTLPQIYQIFYFHNAAGVSVLSWLAFGILDVPFILYGKVHKDKLIFVTYVLWFLANMTVALGAIIYG